MNRSELVSIIVPVYKVEKYLDKCIESIVGQTYENLEIILVDDGSPDNCPAMCDRWAEKDSRIKVIHKENGGLSSARNAGLDACTGEYIYFLDSDDYIADNCIEMLFNAIVSDGSDMCIGNLMSVDESENFVDSYVCPKQRILTPEDIFSTYGNESPIIFIVACGKLYKTKLFSNIRFPENKLHEDEFTFYKVIDLCKAVSVLPDMLYFYVQHTESIMTNITPKRLDSIEAYCNQAEYLLQKGYLNSIEYIRRAASYWFKEILLNSKIKITDQYFITAMRFYKRICKIAVDSVCVDKKTVIKSVIQKVVFAYPLNIVIRKLKGAK